MAKVTIEAAERVCEGIVVYFSDDRVTYVGVDDLHPQSVVQETLLRRGLPQSSLEAQAK
jgi:hypothetical protein